MSTQLGYWDAGSLKRPATDAAGFKVNNGTNFPWDSYEFDASSPESVFAFGKLPQAPIYIASATVKIRICWVTDSSTTGTVVWRMGILGVKSTETWDTAITDYDDVESTRSGSGKKLEAEISLVAPSLEPGDSIVIQITRVADDSGDNYGADASLVEVELLAA